MRYRRSAAVLVSLATLPALAPAAHADPPTGAGAGAGNVVPFVSVGGLSVNDLLAEDFRPFYTGEAVPACKPLVGGKLLRLQADSNCTVKPGTQVLVGLPGATCSDAEEPPYFAATGAEQRACALDAVREGVHEIMVSVDGGPPQDLLSDRFLSVTDQFSVVSQPGNPFGATPGPTKLAAAGYEAVLRGMPPGPHSYVVSGDAFGSRFTAHFTFNVLPGAGR